MTEKIFSLSDFGVKGNLNASFNWDRGLSVKEAKKARAGWVAVLKKAKAEEIHLFELPNGDLGVKWPSMTDYTLIIDTEQYSGNFEMEIDAWVTGLGESNGRAEELSEIARTQIPEFVLDWFEEHTRSEGEYSGSCSILKTPGWHLDHSNNITRDAVDTEKQNCPPAYLSVGIFLTAEPPPDVLAVVKERAASFNSRPGKKDWEPEITITGFRMLTTKTIVVTESKAC